MKRRKKGITAGILALATVISSVQVTLYAAGEEIRSINVSDSYGSEKARDSEVNANPEYTDGKSDKESYESIPYIIGERCIQIRCTIRRTVNGRNTTIHL